MNIDELNETQCRIILDALFTADPSFDIDIVEYEDNIDVIIGNIGKKFPDLLVEWAY